MPELASRVEDWDGRRHTDDAQWRTVRDLRAISDRLGPEYLYVVVEGVKNPAQAEVLDA